jgi:hypothetical protein
MMVDSIYEWEAIFFSHREAHEDHEKNMHAKDGNSGIE